VSFSAKTDYACVAMIELALRYGSREPVRLREIVDAHRIPAQFLVQILLQLKSAGLVESVRGAAGGYRLAHSPDSITLADIVAVIEGPPSSAGADRHSAAGRVLAATWQTLGARQREWLAEVSLATLVERVTNSAEKMYYI
jgi:Rrf2 family protein